MPRSRRSISRLSWDSSVGSALESVLTMGLTDSQMLRKRSSTMLSYSSFAFSLVKLASYSSFSDSGLNLSNAYLKSSMFM